MKPSESIGSLESYSEGKERTKPLSLITEITEIIVEPAHKSDTNALIPMIEALRNFLKREMILIIG